VWATNLRCNFYYICTNRKPLFNNNNLNAKQLSLFIASITAVGFALVIGALTRNWAAALLTLIVSLTVIYLFVAYLIENFVYQKVKLIYKFISNTKASKREAFYNKNLLPQQTLEQANEDVMAWAAQHNATIESLEKNEIFRKEFLQNLSHELKTPIFAIQSYVETLLDGAMKNTELNEKFLSRTARNVDRLVALVNDLDVISKLEAGNVQLNKTNFKIQQVAQEVFENLALKAKEKNITYRISKDCEYPIEVNADKEKIEQVLTNFFDNAIKYGKQNGQIIGSFYKVDNEHVLVEISDDGNGIAAEHLARIFERFYRTDAARSRGQGGSGLGLAICKHIIEAHSKSIHVRSKLDVGSTFGFTLHPTN
jgi:two-component system, OmpR family, phosphate regulon sensor histidine kinase PhoR